jgi:flagellin
MTVINTNTAAINAQYNLSKVQSAMDTAMERLSSGKRINTASDDAAGVAISSRLTAEVKGISMAVRNALDAQAMIDTAEGAHVEVENILQRMRELSVQAANDTNNEADRENLQLEIDQLLVEIDRISETTTWAGKKLMDGTEAQGFNFQIGSGLQAADQVNVKIASASAAALGVGQTAAVAAGPAGSDNPGRMSIEGNKVTIAGDLVNGDVLEMDINDVEVSITFSTTDQYTNDNAGAAAQLKDKIDALVTAGTITSPVNVVDNGDGSISISNSSTPTIDTLTATDTTVTSDKTMTLSGNTVSITGTWAATDVAAVNVNGITATYTLAANDGFADTAVGVAAGLKQAIENQAGLENVQVVDNGDGTLSFSQDTTPVLEAAEVTLNNQQELTLSYNDVAKLTVGGAYVAGKELSFKLFGEEISLVTSDDDAFEDSKAGIANQIATAINNAGISGVTAAKTANENSVTLTAKVVAGNGAATNGTQKLYTTIGAQATATVAVSGSATSVTAATYTAGDAYSFDVAGEKVSIVVGSDGYTNDKYGVAEQLKDAIDAKGIAGITVATSTGTTAAVTITRALTGVTSGSGGSTVVTDVLSRDPVAAGAGASGAPIDVTTADAASDAITRIDAAIQALNTQRAELGAVSNRMDHTVSNLMNISVNLQEGLSRIQDADFATETSNLTKAQILSQAATAMLAQANASKQSVLSLLQG